MELEKRLGDGRHEPEIAGSSNTAARGCSRTAACATSTNWRGRGCEECLATGSSWVHLRMCQSCGVIGCCDSSPNRHASRHAETTGHPIARSAEPGEAWSWCYVDEVAFTAEAR